MSASGGDRAKRPTLVFLHGIQPVEQRRTEGWSETLQSAWDALDLPWSINDVELIEPRYNDLFVGPASEDFDKPTRYAGDKDPGGRRDYEVRRQSLMRLLQADATIHDERSIRIPATDAMLRHAPQLPLPTNFSRVARWYAESPGFRWALLERFMAAIDGRSSLVLIAHSMGSVVARDLLAHMPQGLTLKRLITVGSPLGHDALTRQWNAAERATRFPYPQVGSWVNVWSRHDTVTGGRPVRHSAALNIRLDRGSHDANTYLSQTPVALAVGDALFGNPSRAMVSRSAGVDRARTWQDERVLWLLQAGRTMEACIRAKDAARADRFKAAWALREELVIDAYLRHAEDAGQEPATEVLHAQRDRQLIPLPWAPADTEQWIDELSALLRRSFTDPHNVDVEKFKEEFGQRMAVNFGMSRRDGHQVFRAYEDVREDLEKSGSWSRYLLAGSGVVLLAAATGGVALAAAPGLAGAAAVTSGLAALGPGGMMGGLATVSGLAALGGVTGTLGLQTGSTGYTPAAALDALTSSLARQRLNYPVTADIQPMLDEMLVGAESALAGHEALDDPGSPAAKELKAIVKFCEGALSFATKHGLLIDPTDLSLASR